jgi:putative membrane protein
MYYLLSWFVSAVALWIVGQVVPRFEVRGFGAALIGAAVIAIVDFVIGPILRFISFPITFLTLGLFRLVINAVLLKLAAAFSPGFRIQGFIPALIGALVLTILTGILRYVLL